MRELNVLLEEVTPCKGLNRDQLISAVARVHGELILVHPFREGNGRMARWVSDLMCFQAGEPALNWNFDVDPEGEKERYFAALQNAFALDFTALEGLIRLALERSSRPNHSS